MIMAVVHRATLLALAAIVTASQASAAEAQSNPTALAKNVIQNICARCHDTSPHLKTVPPRPAGQR